MIADALRTIQEVIERMRSDGPRMQSRDAGYVVDANAVDTWADELAAVLTTLQGVQEPPQMIRNRDRELCSQCEGNGVVKIPGGISTCPRCDGDCYEPFAAAPHPERTPVVPPDSRSMKENSDARSELRETCGTAASGFSPQEAPRRASADDVAELDQQITDYKARCDRGETVSGSDARWLLNEMIYQRDHPSARVARPERTVMPSESTFSDVEPASQRGSESHESRIPAIAGAQHPAENTELEDDNCPRCEMDVLDCVCPDPPAEARVPHPERTDMEFAWLIELGCNPPEYWTGRRESGCEFLPNAHEALRFARFEDAEVVRCHIVKDGERRGCKSVQHGFDSASVPHEPPAMRDLLEAILADRSAYQWHNAIRNTLTMQGEAQASRPAPPLDWQPIATAPKGSWPDGPQDIRDPSYVEPPRLWLTLQDGLRCVGYFDAYYAEGGNAYDGEPPWVEVFSGERIRPTHWMPLPDPPTAVPRKEPNAD